MQSLARVSRINVLTAIRDHDQQGAGPFLETLGFEEPSDDILIERGRRYDARALLAYAHGKATGEYLIPDGGAHRILPVLEDLGFKVATREELDRPQPVPGARRVPGTASPKAPAAPRASRAARPSRAAAAPARPEPVEPLCPSCFTQLSKMGTCDYCD